jgi:hypothetical protein
MIFIFIIKKSMINYISLIVSILCIILIISIKIYAIIYINNINNHQRYKNIIINDFHYNSENNFIKK